jgi:hypothetical protein
MQALIVKMNKKAIINLENNIVVILFLKKWRKYLFSEIWKIIENDKNHTKVWDSKNNGERIDLKNHTYSKELKNGQVNDILKSVMKLNKSGDEPIISQFSRNASSNSRLPPTSQFEWRRPIAYVVPCLSGDFHSSSKSWQMWASPSVPVIG